MQNTDKMQELSISQLLNRYNFIIPEIQREYVWGQYYKEQESVINKFFNDLEGQFKEAINSSKRSLQTTENSDYWNITQNIITEYNKQKAINIGFLYSYLPNYHSQTQIRQDVYLIDGQQRFTTLFIMLFFYALKEDKKSDFVSMFRFEYDFNRIAFDYRVRNLTHIFILELINKCNDFSDIKDLQNKTWFLSDFENDVTINSILGTISLLRKNYSNVPSGFFNYLSNKVKFWHFKTEATSQGEELYITMNSRGQSLVDYENIKAKLFEEEKEEKELFGKKWENWQDFFWEHKGNNDNANNGFNEFLKWIAEIERIINKENNKLTLNKIEEYFKTLYFLVEKNDILKATKECLFPSYANFIAQKHNEKKVPLLSDKNKVILYPVLVYLIQSENNLVQYKDYNYCINEPFEKTKIYSTCRFFYNISRNSEAFIESIKLISVSGLKITDDITQLEQYKKNFKNILTDETIFKLNLFKKSSHNRNGIENTFWKAEDNNIVNGRIKNLLLISEKSKSISEIDVEKFDIKRFEEMFNLFEENIGTTDFTSALVASIINFEDFAEGWSWSMRRYSLGQELEKKRQYYQNARYNTVFHELFNNGLTLNEIEARSLEKEPNLHIKKVKTKIIEKGHEYRQWNNKKRFFYNNDTIFFPNGTRAGNNTGELSIND